MVPVEHQAVGGAYLANERRLEQHAVVRDRAIGRGKLNRRHRQLIADRQARRARARPLPGWSQAPRRLGRKLDAGGRAEAECAQHVVLFIGVQPRRKLHQRDIARDADRVRQGQGSHRVFIGDDAVRQLVAATLPRHALAGPHAIEHEECRGREDLGDRARLERLRECRRAHAAVRAA